MSQRNRIKAVPASVSATLQEQLVALPAYVRLETPFNEARLAYDQVRAMVNLAAESESKIGEAVEEGNRSCWERSSNEAGLWALVTLCDNLSDRLEELIRSEGSELDTYVGGADVLTLRAILNEASSRLRPHEQAKTAAGRGEQA